MRLTLQVVLFIVGAQLIHAADYLSPEQRKKVETLILGVEASPTEAENARERAQVLWEWANAYALNGSYIPVNLTQTVSSLLAYPLGTRAARYRQLDEFIRELALLDSEPTALGTLELTGGPFKADTFGTFTQTYTIGTRNVETGGGFLIARHFMPNYGRFQTSDPSADDFVSIGSSNESVKFSLDSHPMSGMHGGFRSAAGSLVFRVTEGTLVQDDTVTIVYGDTSGGGRGLRMPTMSSDFMPFPIYLSLNSNNHFLSLPIQPVTITGTDLAGVHAFAPSIVEAGNPFKISVRAQDRFYNRAVGELPAWSVFLNGQEMAKVSPSTKSIHVLELDGLEEGVYHVTVESEDGSIHGEGNPIQAVNNPTQYIYWGDTHGHSGFAEGVGSPDRFMQWAYEDARLDFVTHSEHDIWMDDAEWQVLIDNVGKFSNDEFIAYLGYEWTMQNYQGGHHNVLFRTAKGRQRIPAQSHGSLSKLYQGLRDAHDPRDVVVIPHAHQPGDYRMNDPALEPLVEIMSQHGTFEWYGLMYLNQGHQVGFTAGSDNHLSQPGYSAPTAGSLSQRAGLGALLAPLKSRDSLFDAMKQLSAYATSGDRMILHFKVNEGRMGQRMPFAKDRLIEGRVIGTDAIDEITVVKNGQEIWKENYRTVASDEVPEQGTFQLSFFSESRPYHPGDNPRGWRVWYGTLTVSGAELLTTEGYDFSNTAVHRLNMIDGNQAEFTTITRGNESSILLNLSNVTPEAAIELQLGSAREFGGGPPKFRRHQQVPEATVTLEFSKMENGVLISTISNVDYVDRIKLRHVDIGGTKDVSFEVADAGTVHGDYYYVRVKQANDAIAWSSPVWIGGYPKK